jgi:hypothetical protein
MAVGGLWMGETYLPTLERMVRTKTNMLELERGSTSASNTKLVLAKLPPNDQGRQLAVPSPPWGEGGRRTDEVRRTALAFSLLAFKFVSVLAFNQ